MWSGGGAHHCYEPGAEVAYNPALIVSTILHVKGLELFWDESLTEVNALSNGLQASNVELSNSTPYFQYHALLGH